MKQDLIASLRAAIVSLLAFTVLTGILYPLVVQGIGQAVFPHQATGASELIGQPFTDPKYLWSRPSAAAYNAMSSTGTNYGPTNPALHEAVAARVQALRAADPENTAPVPADLVTASASGLDPHITPAAAYYQAARIAKARGIAVAVVRGVIRDHIEGRTLGFLGEPRVNVVAVNRALDGRLAAER
jgi:potassium-transporting ATPase KdpC subunit